MRVFLVRHAHASWALPGTRDFDRPLDTRGRDEVRQLAAAMVVNGYEPDLVYCSTARRCEETLTLLLPQLGLSPVIERSDTLYAGSHERYLDLIRASHADSVRSIMIVGHNPMIEDTAQALLQDNSAAFAEALAGGFPTAGLLIVDCPRVEAGWRAGDAQFVALISPADT
ncbi:histidine phosphatase family protein [Hoeflea sp. G2-23]|uniref:Histidine phosphatase family protein n=1 Tax=Hoeflea algicola TaxID=2983763 RepID=A0ABT3Z6F1_9HYPH|nr:histidine phosphatase family protein [Hoeflea algicola]MCY0147286.1 histidine phosphatase family protein [Hoeflea algicola]